MVRYLFYTIGDLTYQSPLVSSVVAPEISALIQYQQVRPTVGLTDLSS